MTVKQLIERAYLTAKSKGFHDKPVEKGTLIALMHSELSEALEAMRKPDRKDEHLPDEDAVGLELADCVIRIFDYCGRFDIDLEDLIVKKMDYNDNRSHMNGGKKF